MLKCDKCGHEGLRSEFRYVSQAHEIGAATYRKCPQCGGLVYCDEMEEDLKAQDIKVWGLHNLRGRTFSGKKKKKKSEPA